jgi:hypothetical protein
MIKRNRENANNGDFERHGEKPKRMGSREDKGYNNKGGGERERDRENKTSTKEYAIANCDIIARQEVQPH